MSEPHFTHRKRRKPQPGLGRLQDLIGRAKNDFLNDRDPMRADKVIAALDEAFEIVLRLRTER